MTVMEDGRVCQPLHLNVIRHFLHLLGCHRPTSTTKRARRVGSGMGGCQLGADGIRPGVNGIRLGVANKVEEQLTSCSGLSVFDDEVPTDEPSNHNTDTQTACLTSPCSRGFSLE